MPNADVVNQYLNAFTAGDVDGAVGCLTDDFTFDGPILQASGKDQFAEGSQMAAAIADGYEMIQQVEQGEVVVSLYNFKVKAPATPGSFTITEWNTVRDGKVASARIVFDTAAMGALMPDMSQE